MFQVNGNPLLADEMAILLELRTQLQLNGIQRFAVFKRSSSNIQFNCPIHANGQERKPSCGVTTQDHKGVPAGTVHCFTCGYKASLEEMISHCFDKNDYGAFGREWLIKNFLSISVFERPSIHLDIGRDQKNSAPVYISEEELEGYRFYHDYMYKRKLTNEVIEQFDVGYDSNFVMDPSKNKRGMECITFPVKDIQGRTLFIARRSISSKFFHYPPEAQKPVYGLYELPSKAEEVIICESMINALTCYVYEKPAVALLGLGTDYQIQQLIKINCRKFIIALDGDQAGRAATLKIKKALSRYKLVTVYQIPEGKDINDLSQEEFENLQEIF